MSTQQSVPLREFVTLALFDEDSEGLCATEDTGFTDTKPDAERQPDRQTDRQMECGVIILVVGLDCFHHRKSLTSGSVGIASNITR